MFLTGLLDLGAYLSFLCRYLSCKGAVLDIVQSHIEKGLLGNASANLFTFFRDFDIHHKDC